MVHPTTPTYHLTTLPAEIHLKVFDLLDIDSSTCLGLTCTKFYPVHRAFHGPVHLKRYHPPGLDFHNLGELLKSWILLALTYNSRLGKFIDIDKLRLLKIQDRWEQKTQAWVHAQLEEEQDSTTTSRTAAIVAGMAYGGCSYATPNDVEKWVAEIEGKSLRGGI
jgi:hypothetical protein